MNTFHKGDRVKLKEIVEPAHDVEFKTGLGKVHKMHIQEHRVPEEVGQVIGISSPGCYMVRVDKRQQGDGDGLREVPPDQMELLERERKHRVTIVVDLTDSQEAALEDEAKEKDYSIEGLLASQVSNYLVEYLGDDCVSYWKTGE